MVNLNNCRFIVWGFKNTYCTHTHIHEAFFRTLQKMGKDVQWLDHKDDLTNVDFSDTFFITEHEAACYDMPIRDDCFYTIHGFYGDPNIQSKFSQHKNHLSWNVYHDFSHVYGTQGSLTLDKTTIIPLTDRILIDEDAPFYPKENHMDFRWATDLVPEEIEANKPTVSWGSKDSKVINWVGTLWFVNAVELAAFKRACDDNDIEFKPVGAGQHGVVSIEENIRLVKESYFAPAVVGSHHITEGYAPCRIFKNISYGQMGITNSPRVNKIFGEKLIFNTDPYALFHEAQEKLASLPLKALHDLMDEVAAKHTYINRINAIIKAATIIMQH